MFLLFQAPSDVGMYGLNVKILMNLRLYAYEKQDESRVFTK